MCCSVLALFDIIPKDSIAQFHMYIYLFILLIKKEEDNCTMMNKTLLRAASKAALQSTVARQRSSVTRASFSRFSKSAGGFAALTFSVVSSNATVALCEAQDKGFLKKDKDGNTDWSKSISQVTEADFWDELAKVAGEKVRAIECAQRTRFFTRRSLSP
jgi:hypothetical protein